MRSVPVVSLLALARSIAGHEVEGPHSLGPQMVCSEGDIHCFALKNCRGHETEPECLGFDPGFRPDTLHARHPPGLETLAAAYKCYPKESCSPTPQAGQIKPCDEAEPGEPCIKPVESHGPRGETVVLTSYDIQTVTVHVTAAVPTATTTSDGDVTYTITGATGYMPPYLPPYVETTSSCSHPSAPSTTVVVPTGQLNATHWVPISASSCHEAGGPVLITVLAVMATIVF